MEPQTVISVLGLLGIGGAVSAYVTHYMQRKLAEHGKSQEFKETRYKCIILLMHAYQNPDKELKHLNERGYSLEGKDDLAELLRTELINAYLFASDDFLFSFEEFIKKPTQENLKKTALCMRKDLWGLKTKLKYEPGSGGNG